MDEALVEALLIVSLIAIGSLTAIYYNTIINGNAELAKEYALTYVKDSVMRVIKESYRRAIASGNLGYDYNGTVTLVFSRAIHISIVGNGSLLQISYMGKVDNITLKELSTILEHSNIKLILFNKTLGSEVSFVHATKIIFNTYIVKDNDTVRISIIEE